MRHRLRLVGSISAILLLLSSACGNLEQAEPAPATPYAVTREGKQVPLLPLDQFKREIEEAKKRAKPTDEQPPEVPNAIATGKSGLTFFIPRPSSVSLAADQTPIRNQGDRGTCWAFAGAAALEAAYRRQYGLNLDLSEQYIYHIGKAGELYSDYATSTATHENNSSFWEGQGSSDVVEKMIRAATPEEKYAPYAFHWQLDELRRRIPAAGTLSDTSSQEALDAFEFDTGHIPLVARQMAKYRPTSSAAISANTTDAIENVLWSGREVMVDVNLRWKWDPAQNAFDHDPSSAGGGHVFLVVGYNRTTKQFLVKNSWGESGLINVTYNFFNNNMLWGHYITGIDVKDPAPQLKAMWLGNWNMDHDGWKGKLVIRRFTDFRNPNADAATKLGNYYRDGKRYDVNGYFTENGRQMVYYIADTEGRVAPGTLSGQRFGTYIFSWDRSNAAGSTSWSGIPFGAALSRSSLPGQPEGSFNASKWIGTFDMNHDGWRGTLTITGVSPLSGNYRGSDGRVLPISGYLESGRPHVLHMSIPFASDNIQPFDLYFHTWERNFFSGVTFWSSLAYGVQATKR